MVPAKGRFVDFSERETATLVGVFDVSLMSVSIVLKSGQAQSRTKSLTVLWNALFPPAVLMAILCNGEASPSRYQECQGIRRGLTAEAAVEPGLESTLGISRNYIQAAQASAVPWCIAWLVKEHSSAANHMGAHEHAVGFAMPETGWPGFGRPALQTTTICRTPRAPQCLLERPRVDVGGKRVRVQHQLVELSSQ